jgi:hypothetical protein
MRPHPLRREFFFDGKKIDLQSRDFARCLTDEFCHKIPSIGGDRAACSYWCAFYRLSLTGTIKLTRRRNGTWTRNVAT